MKTEQMNRLIAYETIEAFLAGAPETSGIVAFPARFHTFKNKLAHLKTLAATQAQRLNVAIADRDTALNIAFTAALTIAGIVLSYADAHQLTSLATRVRVRPGDFKAGRMARRLQLAQEVHDAALAVVAQLGDQGVVEATLEEFQAKIDAAAVALTAPRLLTGEKTAATQRLKAAFRDINATLANQINPLLVPLAATHPEFYARYKSARAVVDRSGGRTSNPAKEPELPTVASHPAPQPAAELRAA